jgi:hypothetical protein
MAYIIIIIIIVIIIMTIVVVLFACVDNIILYNITGGLQRRAFYDVSRFKRPFFVSVLLYTHFDIILRSRVASLATLRRRRDAGSVFVFYTRPSL